MFVTFPIWFTIFTALRFELFAGARFTFKSTFRVVSYTTNTTLSFIPMLFFTMPTYTNFFLGCHCIFKSWSVFITTSNRTCPTVTRHPNPPIIPAAKTKPAKNINTPAVISMIASTTSSLYMSQHHPFKAFFMA